MIRVAQVGSARPTGGAEDPGGRVAFTSEKGVLRPVHAKQSGMLLRRGDRFKCLPARPAKAGVPESDAPRFEEVAAARGIAFVHQSGHATPHLMPEITCGGAALVDFDGDRDIDAYLVQAGSVERPCERPGSELYLNRSEVGHEWGLTPFPFTLPPREEESMATALRIFDATPPGKRLFELRLVVSAPRITVAELIRERILREVERYNAAPGATFRGLVQPSDAEATLNGYAMRARKTIDAEEQCERALRAFERNGFFLLVGDRQAADLDEMLELTDELEISFVKLVPLVGG